MQKDTKLHRFLVAMGSAGILSLMITAIFALSVGLAYVLIWAFTQSLIAGLLLLAVIGFAIMTVFFYFDKKDW